MKTPDDGRKNCPKHAEFYSKNKFEKLVHLVDFIIRIYHDALSPERQIALLYKGNIFVLTWRDWVNNNNKHQGLDPLIRSVSRVTAAHANASSVFQLFSFFVVCSGMISKGFGFVAFFASVKVSSVCVNLSCLV